MNDELLQEYLERGISALESLAQDPEIKVETFPPVCPHCEMMNPVIRVEEEISEGPMGEYVLLANCGNCKNNFYAIPFHWDAVKTLEEAMEVARERANLVNN